MRSFLIFNILLVSLVGCGINNSFSERDSFVQKLEALKFLSDYHHQLHIMIGEEEGDGSQAFNEFSSAINKFSNPKLVPIKTLFDRIESFRVASESAIRLDHLRLLSVRIIATG